MYAPHSLLRLNSVAHKFTPFCVTSTLSPLPRCTILECLRHSNTQRPCGPSSVLPHMNAVGNHADWSHLKSHTTDSSGLWMLPTSHDVFPCLFTLPLSRSYFKPSSFSSKPSTPPPPSLPLANALHPTELRKQRQSDYKLASPHPFTSLHLAYDLALLPAIGQEQSVLHLGCRYLS